MKAPVPSSVSVPCVGAVWAEIVAPFTRSLASTPFLAVTLSTLPAEVE